MKSFFEYLSQDNYIQTFIFQGITDKFEINFLKEIFKNLTNSVLNSKNSDFLSLNFDFFGKLYAKILNHKAKKILGEFYTPHSIVKYILNASNYSHHSNIESKILIDPSCGSGSFLIQAIRELLLRYKKIYNRQNIAEFSLKEAMFIIQEVKKKIHGIDINRIACKLCELNIHFALYELFKIIRNFEEDYHFPFFNIINRNALTIKERNIYDFVVGNPPYLFIRDIPIKIRRVIESLEFKTNTGQYDYYQLFLELGIKLLNNKGYLGYIVPDSILALKNRQIIRKYICENTQIREIYYTGPKFEDPIVSNIILLLEKNKDKLERVRNKIKIKSNSQEEKHILQNKLINWDFNFLIHLNDTDSSILDHLNKNFPKMKDLTVQAGFIIKLSRGVELTKTGEVIFCENCGYYLPIPKKSLICPKCNSLLNAEQIEKIIYNNLPNNDINDFKSFLASINRYNIKKKKYIDITKKGIDYKDLDIYENRIIVRQINQNNLICATYDKNLSLTSQSFYNLKIVKSPVQEFNHFYLLGLLNSKLLSYYFIKSFGSYKKLFPRILIEKLKNLPIKVPRTEKEVKIAKQIIEKVKILLNLKENNKKLKKDLEFEIDYYIFDLYQISQEFQKSIILFIKQL